MARLPYLRRAITVAAAVTAAALLVNPATPALAQGQPGDGSGWEPPAVTGITAVSSTLTWTSPTTDPEVSYYRIYRVTVRNGQPYDQFYNASRTTSLLLALLTPDTEYTFFVETGDQTSNGLRSAPVTFRTLPVPDDPEPPTPPGMPQASAVLPNSLTLTWAPATDNLGVVAYHIYRTLLTGQVESAGVVVAIDNDEPSWSLSRLLPDFDYEYHVVAVDAAGNRSAASPPLRLRTPADPASTCQVSYTVTGQYGGLFEGQFTVTNTGSFAEVYTFRFALPGGQQILWPSLPGWAQSGSDVVLWYEGWAGGLPSGDTIVTFWATHTGSNPPPTGFSLNGQPCTPAQD